MTDRHLVAIGGLPPQAESSRLIDYCLQLTGRTRPGLGFIGTASGDAEAYRQRFLELAGALDCEPSVLPLFDRTPDLARWIGSQDVILVGGGNTKSMLAVWREWGLPQLLRRAWNAGTVLTGWSAGAICWFDEGVTDSCADRLEALPCLGFLPGSCCPHYSGEPDRRPSYHRLLAEGLIASGIAIDDGAAVHFRNDDASRVVCQSAAVGAYSVRRSNGSVTEAPLELDRVVL